MPKHRRRYAASQANVDAAPTSASLVEVAGYGVLGALIAAGVFLVGGQPAWQAVMIVAAAVVVLVVAIVSSRGSRRRVSPSVASSTPRQHGRRRPR